MNKYDPEKHHRRSIRLKGWDYRTAGYYFVTVCSYQRTNIFGNVENGVVQLSPLGEIIKKEWEKTAVLRNNVSLDEFVIMPNHIHGIFQLHNPPVGAGGSPVQNVSSSEKHNTQPANGRTAGKPLQNGSLGIIVGQFKSVVTRDYNRLENTKGAKVWQRGYYERIVRNDRELNAIRRYIQENPARWVEDRENLDVLIARMNGR